MDISRRGFLTGAIAKTEASIPPPWFINTLADYSQCENCDLCAKACPEGILSFNNNTLPRIDFSKGECTFCSDCANQCPASYFSSTENKPWELVAHIDQKCLSQQGVICQTCKDNCPADAINIVFSIGKVPSPSINLANCTGCGACYSPCPTHAIHISTTKTSPTASSHATTALTNATRESLYAR